jgi:hypothetical protein
MSVTSYGNDAPPIADFGSSDVPDPQPKITPRAADGQDNAWPSGDDNAGDGDPGLMGVQGFTGADGGNGEDSAVVNMEITSLDGPLVIDVRAGAGAKGQKGGRGGRGGDGQDGGHGNGGVPAGRGGTGGRGGQGGTGGSGGDGGNAHDVTLTIHNAAGVDINQISNHFAGGRRGGKGDGGPGGAGGQGGAGPGGGAGGVGPEGNQGQSAGSDGPSGHLNLNFM